MNIFAMLLLLTGLTTIAGGLGLIFMNGLGMPISWLDGSPFTSYMGPGLVLLFIVGGTHLLAAVLLFKCYKYALETSAIAGFGMMIFEFFEVYIIRQQHWLQIFYFFIGNVTVVVAWILKGKLLNYGQGN